MALEVSREGVCIYSGTVSRTVCARQLDSCSGRTPSAPSRYSAASAMLRGRRGLSRPEGPIPRRRPRAGSVLRGAGLLEQAASRSGTRATIPGNGAFPARAVHRHPAAHQPCESDGPLWGPNITPVWSLVADMGLGRPDGLSIIQKSIFCYF